MVLVRRIRKRGANIVVEANAEVLFAPTGDVGRWANRFSQRVRAFVAEEAPANKRPRWTHYGKPLKTTMTASTTYQPGRMKVYSAVGSTAPYAAYVDQGTGIFAGRSPWKAKILPPRAQGSPGLYEHTWRPPSGGTAGRGMSVWGRQAVGTVMIKGQRGQFFFDKGLQRAFRSMRMRSFQVPGEGSPKMAAAMRSFPDRLANFTGNTPVNGAFIQQLEQWRAWRDEAFNSGRVIGDYTYDNAEKRRRRARREQTLARQHQARQNARYRRAQLSKDRSQKRRDRLKAEKAAKATDKPAQKKPGLTRAQDRQRVMDKAKKQFGANAIQDITYENGQWVVLVRVLTRREADGEIRPEFKVFRLKARS